MSAWIPTTLALAIMAAAAVPAADAGSCVPRKSSRCGDNSSAVDLNSVPDITKQIVNQEPAAQKQQTPAVEPTAAAPYTGPLIGITSGKPTPTVGYSWSLQ
jgi:hypothetical protein